LLLERLLGYISWSFQEPNGVPQNGQPYFACSAHGAANYIMESALEHYGLGAKAETRR